MKLRRGSIALVVLPVLAVMAVPASASHNSGFSPGTWVKTLPPIQLNLATAFGPFPTVFEIEAGTAPWTPSNTFSATMDTGSFAGIVTFSGSVTCLTIGDLSNGNDGAWFRGVITSTSSALVPAGFGLLGRVVDNDAPAVTSPTTDEAGIFLTPPSPLPTCPMVLFAIAPISTNPPPGNVTVH